MPPPDQKNTPSSEVEAMRRIESAAYVRDAAWVGTLLSQAQKQQFYGDIVLRFEDGVIQRAFKNQSLRPPSEGSEKGAG